MIVFLSYARKYLAMVSFYIWSIKTKLTTWWKIKIIRSTKKYTLVQRGNFTEHNLAIVALHPRKALLASTMRLLESLAENEFDILCIVNDSHLSSTWISKIEKLNATILLRPNIGRDFGAYKVAFQFALETGMISRIKKLVFANDSVVYGNNSKEFLKRLLNESSPWTSMFVNYQFHTHAQSFFQIFDSEIFSNRAFSDFWLHYYPSEQRHLVINKGEVALSQLCIRIGYSPRPFVTARLIQDSPLFNSFQYDEEFALWSNVGSKYLDSSSVTNEKTLHLLRRAFLELNATHHVGLLASRVLYAPLKMDIFQTGLATREGIQSTLLTMGMSEDEMLLLLDEMTLKGTHASKRGFKRIWNSYGYV